MSFFKSHKDGRPQWRVRWNYRTDENGKQIYDERRFSRRADAVAFDRIKTAGHSQTTETITVGQLAARWFAEHVDTNLAQRTRKDYRCHYRDRIGPRLGSRRVAKLTPRLLNDFRDELVASGVGARTVDKSLDALKSMVRWGQGEGLCANTMIHVVRRAKAVPPKPANPYPPDTVARIAAASPWLREATLILVAAYSGLRWSELRALRWTDVDFDNERIAVTKALDLDKSDKSTKSRKHRIAPVFAPGLDALRVWREHVPGAEYVFPTRNDRPLGENGWFGQRLPKIRKACGIHFDLHEMRDTYASLLIHAGVREAELTLWMGHEHLQTTLDRYGRLFDEVQTQRVDEVNAKLAKMFDAPARAVSS